MHIRWNDDDTEANASDVNAAAATGPQAPRPTDTSLGSPATNLKTAAQVACTACFMPNGRGQIPSFAAIARALQARDASGTHATTAHANTSPCTTMHANP